MSHRRRRSHGRQRIEKVMAAAQPAANANANTNASVSNASVSNTANTANDTTGH